MTTGERIGELRRRAGLSQEELADRLEVSRQTISNWENDRVTPDTARAAQLCRVLGTSMDALFCGGAEREKDAPAAAHGRRSGLAMAAAIAGILLAASAAIFAAVVGILGLGDLSEASSTVTLTGSAGLILLGTVLLAACAAALIVLYRRRRKK